MSRMAGVLSVAESFAPQLSLAVHGYWKRGGTAGFYIDGNLVDTTDLPAKLFALLVCLIKAATRSGARGGHPASGSVPPEQLADQLAALRHHWGTDGFYMLRDVYRAVYELRKLLGNSRVRFHLRPPVEDAKEFARKLLRKGNLGYFLDVAKPNISLEILDDDEPEPDTAGQFNSTRRPSSATEFSRSSQELHRVRAH
jgi:hypothetical protein